MPVSKALRSCHSVKGMVDPLAVLLQHRLAVIMLMMCCCCMVQDSLPTGQRFGVFGVVVGIFIFLWVLARGYFIRMPYEKMELQAKKGR